MKFLNFAKIIQSARRPVQRLLVGLTGALVAITLTACAGGVPPTGSLDAALTVPSGRDYLPGGYWMYAWGIAQTKENFANVERAQSTYEIATKQRVWKNTEAGGRPSATMLGLQSYLPLHVRWKLKDGREFILENIDIRRIMQEYFKTHEIKLQWQIENRAQDRVGDFSPMLSFEVKDEFVLIKWVITINKTPVSQRLTVSGAATRWDTFDQYYPVTTIPGKPTSNIDFSKQFEFFK